MKFKKIGFSDYEIKDKLVQISILKDWTPITVRELQNMNKDQLKKLLSFCWHDGHYRCHAIGITNVIIEFKQNYINLKWSDNTGDPNTYVHNIDELINNVGDGEWNYGLFTKKTMF